MKALHLLIHALFPFQYFSKSSAAACLDFIIPFLSLPLNQSWGVWVYQQHEKGFLILSLPFDSALILKIQWKKTKDVSKATKNSWEYHTMHRIGVRGQLWKDMVPLPDSCFHHKEKNGRIYYFPLGLEFCYFS